MKVDRSEGIHCTPEIEIGDELIPLSTTVHYKKELTARITDISPKYGPVEGGTLVTITGKRFPEDLSLYNLYFDEVECVVQTAISTEITCLTSPRPGFYPEPTIDFTLTGYGNVFTRRHKFQYVSLWSSINTWGGELPPLEGESIWIPPGMHLLVDVDVTPILNLVLVEGSLIFTPEDDPTHTRYFDAHYINVHVGGEMTVGTEDCPYTSKLIITLHGDKDTPEIPTYGNKVLAVRGGTLDLHGVERDPVWTELEVTASDTDIITLVRAVDWQIGEEIVIASSNYKQ